MISCFCYSQNTKTQSINEEKIKFLQEKVNLLHETINKQEKIFTEEIAAVKKDTKEEIAKYKDDTKDLINLYVFFIVGILSVIAFAINFLGKRAIKKRVEEIISETAQTHIESKIVETLNSKITNELIENALKTKSEEEINKLIAALEAKGNTAIDQFKTKGNEVIKSMLASPPKFTIRLHGRPLSDKEISSQNNNLRAEEFFNLAFNAKDPRIKIELYKNVLEINPNQLEAMNNMAVSYNDLNEPNNSLEVLNKLIKINPNYSKAYANRAQAYNLLNEFDKALEDISNVIKIDPKLEYAYSVKGNILTKQEKFAEAEKALHTAIDMNSKSPEAYFNRAFFYEERGEYEKSKLDYEKAETLGFSNKAMLYNNMAVLFRRTKEFDKAIEFVEKARQFNPNFPNIDGTVALIYADKGEDEKFYSNLKTALEKGCPAWNYLKDPGFNKYRNEKRLQMLIEPYRKKFFAQ